MRNGKTAEEVDIGALLEASCGEMLPYGMLKRLPIEEAVVFVLVKAICHNGYREERNNYHPVTDEWLAETFPLQPVAKTRKILRRLCKRKLLSEKWLMYEEEEGFEVKGRTEWKKIQKESLAYKVICQWIDENGIGGRNEEK